jgi:hypothetical protein
MTPQQIRTVFIRLMQQFPVGHDSYPQKEIARFVQVTFFQTKFGQNEQ